MTDTNESNFSAGESSKDEMSKNSSDEEEADSTEADKVEGPSTADLPAGHLKSKYVKKRYTLLKREFDQEAVSFENDFPLSPAEPLNAKQYLDMFVSRSMFKAIVEESSKYYFQKHKTPLNLRAEELTPVWGIFFRIGL